jgi:hypothetical protein
MVSSFIKPSFSTVKILQQKNIYSIGSCEISLFKEINFVNKTITQKKENYFFPKIIFSRQKYFPAKNIFPPKT